MKAFVEVKYVDDGASLAGASSGRIKSSTVVEVEGESISEVCNLASEKLRTYTTAPLSTRFIRWIE